MLDWQNKVALNPGETLRVDDLQRKGFLEETEIYECSIIDVNGTIVGSVRATDRTAVRGLRRTISIRQTNAVGQIVVDERWSA